MTEGKKSIKKTAFGKKHRANGKSECSRQKSDKAGSISPFHSLILLNPCDIIQGEIIHIDVGERTDVKHFLYI